MTNKKILVTGFEPFADNKENPSGMLAQYLNDSHPDIIHGEVLPVEYISAREKLIVLLDTFHPEICICTGLAKGDTFRLETWARKPEQYNHIQGDKEYHSLIPANISQFCQEQPNYTISKNCGQYVCEATLWTLLDYCCKHTNPTTAFFFHVPAICDNWPYSTILEKALPLFNEIIA